MPKPTPWNSCTAQRSDGSFCDRPSLPDAPFPICLKHAAQLYAFLQGSVHDTLETRDVPLAAVDALLKSQAETYVGPVTGPDPVIYYLQVGDRIKIGTTTWLEQRIRTYPPGSVLLATEPGDAAVERERHRQFNAHLVAGREWFTPGPLLVEHVNKIRKANGLAPVPD